MYKKTLLSLAVASTVGLTGCFSDGGSKNAGATTAPTPGQAEQGTYPIFNPVTSALPVPNDLIFDSEAGDGTFEVTDDQPPVTTALNSLSGASTVAPPVIQFNGEIDESTVEIGKTVFVIAVDYASGDPVQALSLGAPPTASSSQPMNDGELRADVEMLDGQSAIRIMPLKPLEPRQRYVVGITRGVKDANGDPIVADPAYAELTQEEEIPVSDLASVKSLINGFWEPTLSKATQLPADRFAMSYSFTTSNDEKVLEYIAEPGTWFADQFETFVGVSTSRQVTGAARFLNGDELTVEGGWDINGDGNVTAADFDVNSDGNLTPADFDFDGNGEFGYQDVNLAVQNAKSSFPNAGIQQALSPIFDAAPPNGCQGLTNVAAMKCAGNALATTSVSEGGFADLLPDFRDGGINFESASPVGGISAVAESLRSELPDQNPNGGTKRPGVLTAQSTIELPYFLGTEADTVQTVNWEADSELAAALNEAFQPLGLSIPQADPDVTKAVNYIFPFPKERTTVDAPVLALYPSDIGSNDPKGVVMYQHGITTDRSAALTFGTALASYGYVVVAIDQPLHGVTPVSEEEQLGLAVELLGGAGLSEDQADQLAPAVVGGDRSTLTDAGLSPEQATSLINTVAGSGSTVPGIQNSGNERHFNLFADSRNQVQTMSFDSSDPVGADESGSLYINLTNFLAARDNNRQSAVDQMTLRASLNNLALPDGMGGTAYTLSTEVSDPANEPNDEVFFSGHSLGTVTGTPYISSVNQNTLNIADGAPGNSTGGPIPLANVNNDVEAASMLTPGGGMVRLLENSPTFAPQILLGLQAEGVNQGTASYESFLNVFQHAFDSADPVNFTDNDGLRNTPQLLSMVEGDSVIPNAADADVWGDGNDRLNRTVPAEESTVSVPVTVNSFPAPLAGTLPLTQAFGTGITDGQSSPMFKTYSSGSHSTPVSAEPASVFVQMVLETDATFNPQN